MHKHLRRANANTHAYIYSHSDAYGYADAEYNTEGCSHAEGPPDAEGAPYSAAARDTRTASTFASPYRLAAAHSASSFNTSAHAIFAEADSGSSSLAKLRYPPGIANRRFKFHKRR